MLQENDKILLIIFLIMLLVPLSMVLLFIIFNNRKNKLIRQQLHAQKQFERELAESQIEIREETLRNISWELHDNIGQLLTLAKIQLQNSDNNPEIIKESVGILGNALQEVRALSKSINSESLKNMGLLEAVHNEMERLERMRFLKSELKIKGTPFFIPDKEEIILFRILQESFSNVIRHSRATELKVEFMYNDTNLTIQCEDNGIGFNQDSDFEGIGLKNIKTRAKMIDAELFVNSKVNQGTKITLKKTFK